ncbi:MAG: hypothetical protein JSR15_01815 [Proteobacteria bacterium]|nr:hypothetical protein [Pseudomonadota bacterium]
MLRLADCDHGALARLLYAYGLDLRLVAAGDAIPGSYWGESEAGLKGSTLLARHDTPIHSILHEAAHFICMTPERRVGLDRDAGGDDDEEHAVCYLQVLLADGVRGFGRERAFRDMDEWGYSFRLGSTRAWFEQDAEGAREWLQAHGIIDADAALTGGLRDA